MYSGKTVFSQVVEAIHLQQFSRCVERYGGDRKVRHFSCWDQFLCMAFAQLTFRESLRDIENCLSSRSGQLYHMGFRADSISRSTLADANEARDWRIYADLGQKLIAKARRLYGGEELSLGLKEMVYVLDSSTVDLCLSLFRWARFRTTKSAIKIHTLLDLRGPIPSFVEVTDGKFHDSFMLDALLIEPGAFYVMDRGYMDFARLYHLHRACAYFVIRGKANLSFRRHRSLPVDRSSGLRSDHIGVFCGHYFAQGLPRAAAPRALSRLGDPKDACLFDQPHEPGCAHRLRALQVALAGGTLLQMDQGAPAHQDLLRHLGQRGENPGLDRDLCVCADRNPQE
jgi:hypothetical protein